jgi:hypothetical protein
MSEQLQIVERIEVAFSRMERMLSEATRAGDLLDRFGGAALAKAFRGELTSNGSRARLESSGCERAEAWYLFSPSESD